MIAQFKRIVQLSFVAFFLSLVAAAYVSAGGPLKEKIQKRLSESSNIQYQQFDDYNAPQASAPAVPEERQRAVFRDSDSPQQVFAVADEETGRSNELENNRREVASFAIY